jgi:hypothetical protein
MTFLAPEADRIVRTAVDAYFEGRLRPEIDGEAVFETRNSRYRLVDGTLLSASDTTLVGCELVGWLTESTAVVQVGPWWTPGARAVLVDRQQGRHIVVTSATRLLKVDTLGRVRGSLSPLGGSGARQGSPAPAPIVAAVVAHPPTAQPPSTGALPVFPEPVPATPHAPYVALSAAPLAHASAQPQPQAPVAHYPQAPAYAAYPPHPAPPPPTTPPHAPPTPHHAAYSPTEPAGGAYVSPAAQLPLPPRRRDVSPVRPSTPAEAPPFAVALSVPPAPPPPRIEPAPESPSWRVRRADPVHPPPRRVAPEGYGLSSRPLASPSAPPRPGARASGPPPSQPAPRAQASRSEWPPVSERAPDTLSEPLPRFFNDDSVAGATPPIDPESSAPEISIVEVLGDVGAGGALPRFADPQSIVPPGDDADTERQLAARPRPAPPPPGPLASPRGKHTPPPPPSERFPISGR